MEEQKIQTDLNVARGLARMFSVDVTIKMFGHVVWEYHFPPKTDKP